MALSTYPVYGDTDELYDILLGSGLFTSVTKSTVDSVKTITCSDPEGTRLIVKVTGLSNGDTIGTNVGYTYYYGNNKRFYSLTYDGDPSNYQEVNYDRFPYIVYKTTSTLVITVAGSKGQSRVKSAVILTKDNNGSVGLVCDSGDDKAFWDQSNVSSVSKDAPSALSMNYIAAVRSAATIVPFTTNDVSKTVYFPKVFRGVATQYRTDQVGLATLNNNEYLSLYGAVFVKID